MRHSATIHVSENDDGRIEVSVHSDPPLTASNSPRSDLQLVVDRMIMAAQGCRLSGMDVRIAEQ